MGLLIEALLAGLCAAGLAFFAWWLFDRVLRPLPGQGVCALLPGRGDGEGLEQSVRAFVWLRSLGLLSCCVVIADLDLTAQGREVALRLALIVARLALLVRLTLLSGILTGRLRRLRRGH